MIEFDIALSFAGEDRVVAESLAKYLKLFGLLVFYDDDRQADLLGETLTEYLIEVYQRKASYTVVLVSADYLRKRWARHEWRAAQARAFEDFDDTYILPIRIDDTELPGLLEIIGHLDIRKKPISVIAEIINSKVKGTARINKAIRSADKSFANGEFDAVIDILSPYGVFKEILNHRIALRLLADAYMATVRYEKACETYLIISGRFQEDVSSKYYYGVCLHRLGNYSKAIAVYKEVLRLKPLHNRASRDMAVAKLLLVLLKIPIVGKRLARLL